jgi:uncharacterized protein
MKALLFSIMRVAVAVYAGLLLVLAGCQRRMLYYPTRSAEVQIVQMAALDGLEPWRAEDGTLIGWRPSELERDQDVLLVFHGNAGFAAHRGYFVHGFSPSLAVYLFEYPGYGARSGRPSEPAFFAAGAEALQQIRTEHEGRILLGGESLGSGVACYLAGTYPDQVDGLFLSTPFNSLVDVARSHYPIFPVRWLLRDRYESAVYLKNYHGPIAFLLAERDEVIPMRFGRKLHDGYHGPKRIWLQAGRSHNTLDYDAHRSWWDEVLDFLLTPEP